MNRPTFKLVSFNVQNLGRGDSPDPAAYAAKLEFVTDVLRRIDADLVVVDEVREPESFDELADALACYPARLLGDPPDKLRRIQTGVLSRLPVQEQGQWLDYPAAVPGTLGGLTRFRFRRPMPWLRVALPNGETLLAVAVHLKSQRAQYEDVPESEPLRRRRLLGRALSGMMRLAEAAGLRSLLDEAAERDAADHYAVLGDFNDGPESLTLSIVMALDSDDSGELVQDEKRRLFPVAARVPAARAFSYVRRGRKALLDQILVSQKLSLCITAAGAESQLLEADMRYDADSTAGYPRSDHAPVWAAFELPA